MKKFIMSTAKPRDLALWICRTNFEHTPISIEIESSQLELINLNPLTDETFPF